MAQSETIYVGQSQLRIQLTLGVNVASATCIIRYKKPGGTVGHWDATILTPLTGVIYYDVLTVNEIDEAGTWTLWPYVTFADTRSAPGASTTMRVDPEPGVET